jgi:hypothetical protein
MNHILNFSGIIMNYKFIKSKNDFLKIKLYKNTIYIYLDERFIPDDNDLIGRDMIFFAIGLLNSQFKFSEKHAISFNSNYLNHNLSLLEKNYFQRLKYQYPSIILDDDILSEIISCSLHNLNYESILHKIKYKLSLKSNLNNIEITHKINSDFNQMLLFLKSKQDFLIVKKSNLFFETFHMNNSKTELKGSFFELILQLLFFYESPYFFKADWSTISPGKDMSRVKNSIYPDILGLSEDKSHLLIFDGKYYKKASDISVKEVLMNEIAVLSSLYEKKINFLKTYNIALIPQKLTDKPFIINSVKTIKEYKVIIISIDIFNFISKGVTINDIILSIEETEREPIIFNKHSIDWLTSYLK